MISLKKIPFLFFVMFFTSQAISATYKVTVEYDIDDLIASHVAPDEGRNENWYIAFYDSNSKELINHILLPPSSQKNSNSYFPELILNLKKDVTSLYVEIGDGDWGGTVLPYNNWIDKIQAPYWGIVSWFANTDDTTEIPIGLSFKADTEEAFLRVESYSYNSQNQIPNTPFNKTVVSAVSIGTKRTNEPWQGKEVRLKDLREVSLNNTDTLSSDFTFDSLEGIGSNSFLLKKPNLLFSQLREKIKETIYNSYPLTIKFRKIPTPREDLIKE